MRKKIIVAIVLAISLSLTGCGNSQPIIKVSEKSEYKTLQTELNTYMEKYCEDNILFSGSVLVAKGDDILLSQGFGKADYDKDIVNTPDTIFEIGSVTKQFTAMAILMLEEKGKLSTEDTLDKYIPDFPSGDKIKIYNLLTMTSGIGEYIVEKNANLYIEDKNYSPDEIIDVFKGENLNFEVGTKFEYSNSNYILLGYIIEKVSGITYEEFLQENIFKPLNMENTSFITNDIVKNKAIGYGVPKDVNSRYVPTTVFNGSMAYSAGNVTSNVEDMYKWSRALWTNKLVKRKTLKKMYTPYLNSYAMGWLLYGSTDGSKTVFHGGNTFGFSSIIKRDINKEYTVIILTNRAYYPDLAKLSSRLISILNKDF